MTTVVILTRRYPFGPGEEFIAPEAAHWAELGSRVVVMPWFAVAEDATPVQPLPDGVELDLTLSRASSRTGLAATLRGLASPRLVSELRRHGRLAWSKPGLTQLVTALRGTRVARDALAGWTAAHGPIDLVYSYWFDVWTLGALDLKGRGVRAVASRVHGYDVHLDRHPAGFHALKQALGPRLDLLLPVSESGARAAISHFGLDPARVKLAHLGIVVPDRPEPGSTDGIRRILSVAVATPVKRIDRLLDGLTALANQHPDWSLHWTHVGGGPLLPDLQAAAQQAPANLTIDWLGQLTPAELTDLYRSRRFDLIANTSDSEGIPVSIMEAMGHGIPAVATAVGGTGELVPEHGPGGRLVPASDQPQPLAEALDDLLATADPAERAAARAIVQAEFDADRNASQVVALLREVAAG